MGPRTGAGSAVSAAVPAARRQAEAALTARGRVAAVEHAHEAQRLGEVRL